MARIGGAVLLCLTLLVVFGMTLVASPTLRISLPPVMESLPIAFASQWNLFEEHGVSVELLGITDNGERTTALMSGNLDAVMEDVTRSILDIAGGWDVIITGAATSRPQTGSIRLALLGHASFGVESFETFLDSNMRIWTLYRSDHEYLLDHLMAMNGHETAWASRYVYFSDVLNLAVWFGAQSIPVVVLPEPYITYIATAPPPGGEAPKLIMLSDFGDSDPLPTLILFRRAFAEENPDVVKAFYEAYVEAIDRLNATPRDELIETGIDAVISLFFQGANRATIPQEALDSISIPFFAPPAPLAQEQYESVLAWMEQKGYVSVDLDYEDVVDHRFLP